ncbi:hypothetical protein ACEVLR_RS27360, partial [Escherichia coli]
AAQRDNASAQREVALTQGQRYVDALHQAHTAEIITGVQNMEQEQDVLQQQMLYTLQQRMNEMSL